MTIPAVSEAASLLEHGALYRSRVGLQSRASELDLIFAGIKTGIFSIYSGDQPYFHFDLDGRWQRAFISGIHYLKGLDGSVRGIDRVREGHGLVLDRRVLSYAEASDLDAYIRSFVLEMAADVNAGRLVRIEPSPGEKVVSLGADELLDLCDRIAGWDAAAWFSQRERYLNTYGPLPLIPPDCHNAVIFQGTLGHADGRAFGCAAPAEYYARSVKEFEQHARDVARLLGRRAADCRMILLLGVDLIRQPAEVVSGVLAVAARAFAEGGDRARPIHVVIDDFSANLVDEQHWKEWRGLGLSRVTLEIESGDPAVRHLYGRAWRDADLLETVRSIKAAGVGVNVLTLVGAGGTAMASEHLRQTSGLLAAMELDRGDLVFLLDERELAEPGLGPTEVVSHSSEAWDEQAGQLKNELSGLKDRGVKVSLYNVGKQRS